MRIRQRDAIAKEKQLRVDEFRLKCTINKRYGMTQDRNENIETFQELVTSIKTTKKEEDVDPTASGSVHPTIYGGSACGIEEINKPTADGRSTLLSLVRPTIHDRARPTVDDVNIIIMYGMKSYRRECEEYHEGYDHADHTHDEYNFGAYGRNDCEERWRDSERDECSKEKENDLEKNERAKEMSEEKQKTSKEELDDRRGMEKEPGPIPEDLSASLSLNPSSLCYEDPLMNSSAMFDLSCYGYGNLDDTSLVELNILGLAFEFDRNSLQHVSTITSRRGRRHTMEFEGQGENNHVEKHLVYSRAFVDFLFKGEALNETIVQNTKSCVKNENQSLGATLLYSLTFKEFLVS
ncbi:hypothetical protein M9H77_06379 [Catharanthus roseus]|uniref:Uncharacterized protein n=1 Tax=Catharanthus roseus TaxID=4058 RepID=A0ACC0BS41_CATRO|nr:hypothetical protein M9H77_06379 [Catharanthus roseus]